VNLAAKLEKHCKRERAVAVLPLETLRLARAQGLVPVEPWETRRAREVGGVPHSVDLAVLPVALG
jgi:hypothetical protein